MLEIYFYSEKYLYLKLAHCYSKEWKPLGIQSVMWWLYWHTKPPPHLHSPTQNPTPLVFFYSFSPWRAICHRKKLVFCLVHEINGKHRAPLPSVIHAASSSKAIMPCFNYLCTEKVSLYYQYFLTCFWSLIRLCGFNGLFLMTKRWAQLKILPTCKANEDFIKKTMLYSNPYLTLLSTHDT